MTFSNRLETTVVLMSGGIDSTATAAACLQTGKITRGIFFDYGQPTSRSEWKAAQKVANHYRIGIEKFRLGFKLQSREGEFFGRNALFILATAGIIEDRPLVIATGIHALSDYYDTTPLFVKHTQQILNGYAGGWVTVAAPFLAKTKAEVVAFAKKEFVPLHLTYSCEWRNAPACENCPSCLERSALDVG